jgi:hypothetical protein
MTTPIGKEETDKWIDLYEIPRSHHPPVTPPQVPAGNVRQEPEGGSGRSLPTLYGMG